MRILLCYPPLAPTDSAAELQRRCDRDNAEMPLGMPILGAQLLEAGHDVQLENLALVPWRETLARIEAFAPDLFGVSCYTFHRHTVAALTREVRTRLPQTKIVVGGVHVSPLHEITLERWPWIDFVAVSESEASLPPLVERLAKGDDVAGLLGIAHRDESGMPVFAGRAPQIADLDSLPIGASHWPNWIVSTSRGCPFVCNFCSSPSIWGRKVRERSPMHVVAELEMLRRGGLRQVAFKDETFTLRRQRVEELCQAMIDAGLNLWWTCDTRADCLDEERLTWLRRAGCFEISLGVETGSPDLVRYYDKREKPEKVIEATRLARKFGIHVRHYYIVGAPAETEKTLRDTLNLIEASRPQRVFLAALSVLPGTGLHHEMIEKRGWTDDVWFERTDEWMLADRKRSFERFKSYGELRRRFHNSGQEAQVEGLLHPLTLDDLREAATRVPDSFACQYDLGQMAMAEGRHDEAALSLQRCVELHPGLGKAWLDLGDCLRRRGRPEDALAALERVEGISEETRDNRLLALLRRAEVLRDLNRGNDALVLCARVIEEEPRVTEAHAIATTTLLQQSRFDEAEQVAEAWLRVDSNDARAHSVLAGCLFAAGRLEEALAHFEAASRLRPSDPEILSNTAIVLMRLQRPTEARRHLRQCLSVQPNDTKAQRLLAMCPAA